LDIIKAKVAFSKDLIQLRQIHLMSLEFHRHPRYATNPTDDITELWTSDMIEQLIDNIKLLRKQRVLNPESVYSAILDALTSLRPHTPPQGIDAEVFCYMIRHPMTPFTEMAKALNRNRSTVYGAFKRLQAHHWVRTMARNDLTAFGLRSCILFSRLKDSVEWEPLRERLFNFLFLKSVHKVSNSNNALIVFIIPGSDEIVSSFEKGVRKVSSQLFDYSSLHVFEGSACYINPSLLHEGK